MEKKSDFGKKLNSFFAGKGFYIVLFLCVAVIGVSAWVMFGGNGANVDNDSIGLNAGNPPPGATVPVYSVRETPDVFTGADTPKEPEDIDVADPPEAPDTAVFEEPDAPAVPVVNERPTFVWPVNGEIERPYSVDRLLYDPTMADWRTHDGIDIAASLGDQVLAVSAGKVERIYKDDLLGTTVIIDHGGGLKSFYSNLAATPTVVEGDNVTAGMVIGSVGDTAIGETGLCVHLHFAMTLDGRPMDPANYLP